MSGLLEVVALHAADAQRAEAGGADRIELVGSMDDGGMAPPVDLVRGVRRATSVQLRGMVRLREGFSADGGEVVRLKGLLASYRDLGADGMVLGFLNGHSEVDLEVMGALLDEGDWPFTFHRAIDATFDTDKAWRALLGLPRLDQVLTAGSARGVEEGLDDLIKRAKADERIARLMMAGGGLHPDHVPWLVRAGVRAFHVGTPVRVSRSYKYYIDEQLVGSWRSLIDATVAHQRGIAGS